MSTLTDSVIDAILAEESGAYTNTLGDSGGPTRWGITQATLSEYLGRPASAAEVQALERPAAREVLYSRYITRPHFDAVLAISATIGERLVDGGVLCGPGTLTELLQRSLNALNSNASKYADIAVDGAVGAGTLVALRSFLVWRGGAGERVLLVAIECLEGAHFIEDAEARPKDEEWLFGWLQQRIRMDDNVGSNKTGRA